MASYDHTIGHGQFMDYFAEWGKLFLIWVELVVSGINHID